MLWALFLILCKTILWWFYWDSCLLCKSFYQLNPYPPPTLNTQQETQRLSIIQSYMIACAHDCTCRWLAQSVAFKQLCSKHKLSGKSKRDLWALNYIGNWAKSNLNITTYPEIGDAKLQYALWKLSTVISIKEASTLWNFYWSCTSLWCAS